MTFSAETIKTLNDLLDWHEDNARELDGDSEQQEMFAFHLEATKALADIVRAFSNKEGA
jgi:hypothetical protein